MNLPNLHQRLYLAKALNEDTNGIFDHEEINEARPGTNRAAITGASALAKKVGTKPENKFKKVPNPKWEGPGKGNQPQYISKPISEDHDEICEILAEMLNRVLGEGTPKQHSPRNQAAIDAMKKNAAEKKKKRDAEAREAMRTAKPIGKLTDHGARDWWRSRGSGIAEEFHDELEEANEISPAVQAIIDRMKKKALKGAKKRMRVVDARKSKPSGDDAYAGSNPSAMRHDPDMRNKGAVAEEVHEYRKGRKVNRLVPRGTDPYDILTKEGGKRGKAISMHGKLTKRLDSLSPETRAKYRRLYGYRTTMGRLYPMMEAKNYGKVKKAIKGIVRDVKRAGKGVVKALGTPQSNTDYQITGRKF